MWADGGAGPSARASGPSKPEQVADAVIKGIEKDKAEIDVGRSFDAVRRLAVRARARRRRGDHQAQRGDEQVADALAERQREKR